MKYLECKFANSARTYTYSTDDDSIGPGDLVDVETKTGIRTIEVVSTPLAPPPGVAIKSVIGKSANSLD